jgi:cyclopropane fatty-acyl-phospholipid synthase-like methyltransferase
MNINKDFQTRYFDLEKNQFMHIETGNLPVNIQKELDPIITKLKENNISEVVDFGCGTGKLTIELLKNHFHVLAVDISNNSLTRFKKYAKKLGIRKRLKTANYIREETDAIVGIDVLHHININKYFRHFHSKLKQKGMIIFLEPNCFNFCWYIFNTYKKIWFVEKGIFQCSYYNFIRLLKRNGYGKIKISGYGLLPPRIFNTLPQLEKLNRYLSNFPILKFFSYRFVIEAYKS